MTTLTEEMRSRGDAKLHEPDEGRGPFLPSHLHFTFRIFYHLHSLRTIGGRADLSRAVVSSTMRKVFVVASLALLFYFKGSLEYPNPATP